MTTWAGLITRWSDPAWRGQHRTAVVSTCLCAGVLAFFLWSLIRSWPDASSQERPLDRDEAAYFEGVTDDSNTREQFMLTHGVRVILPDVQIITNDDGEGHTYDENGPQYCPAAFPVIGTTYGVYYVDTDPMFTEFDSQSDKIALCFANENAARAAGYIHGPIASPVSQ